MLKRLGFLLFFCLTGCAMSSSVANMNVDYNYSLETITNQLTLLNILRAKDGLPLHYTSVLRLTGSVSFQGTAGINAQIKGGAPTATSSTQNTDAPTGTTITDTVARAVATGGNIYTPSLGAQITTGPSFDVSILDSQSFYQGILTSLPFSTVEDFILQGYDNAWIMGLLIEEVDFEPTPTAPGIAQTDQSTATKMVNAVPTLPESPFPQFIECYRLDSVTPPATKLTPISFLAGSSKNGKFTLQDLAQLDGTKLDITNPISTSSGMDNSVWVVRPSSKKQVPHLTLSGSSDCQADKIELSTGSRLATYLLPNYPPPEPVYIGSGQQLFLSSSGKSAAVVSTTMTMTFRSTEGVIRFLGECLYEDEINGKDGPYIMCKEGDDVLFALHKGSSDDAIVSADIRGQSYYVDPAFYPRRTMDAIGLIERLVDLQKSATQGPATIPVQVVP